MSSQLPATRALLAMRERLQRWRSERRAFNHQKWLRKHGRVSTTWGPTPLRAPDITQCRRFAPWRVHAPEVRQ